ncbi:MAG: MoaD/ThiS family protein [Methylococcaceae bacterium]
MSIKVQYFASLKELTNHSDLEVAFTQPVTVVNLWSQINPDVPLPENILVAINMDYAQLSDLIQDGDEVAFFPPVTGG